MNNHKTFAIDLAYQAGKVMRENFVFEIETAMKPNNTFITNSDTQINHFVIEQIQRNFPEHSVLGEEESNLKESEYMWVCDPIDGTTPFSHGMPLATFSLALVKSGNPILGVVYDPFMDRMFVAESGKGAYLNDKRITVCVAKTLANALIYLPFKKQDSENIGISTTLLNKLIDLHAKVIDIHASAYAGILVAAGSLIGMVFPHTTPWDIAAVKILVEEAGGTCTDFQGRDQRYDKAVNGFIATNGLIHAQLLELVQEYRIKKH